MNYQIEYFKRDLAQLFKTYGFGVEEDCYEGGPLYLTIDGKSVFTEDMNEITKDAILKYGDATSIRTV
jgi:hypothetical protein